MEPNKATVDTFRPALNTEFRIGSGENELVLELVEAEASRLSQWDGRALGKSGSVRTDPFALVFMGPAERVLQQGIYRLQHADLGELDLFLVPVGPGSNGMQYEAVFN